MSDLKEVKLRFQNCSTAIKNGRVHRRSNYFFEFFIRRLFRKIDFDGASLATLRELDEKGHLVFASFHSSTTSLLILTSLLRRHGLKVPMLAMGIRPYLYQMLSNTVRLVFRSLRRLFLGKKFRPVADLECIRGVLRDREGVIVSVLSKKLFLLRYLEKRRDPLQDVIEIQKELETPVYLVPQLIFWNMNPEKTRTFLASRATGDRGLFSALFATYKSVTPPSMRIAPPLNLKEFMAEHPDDSPRLLAQRVRQKLLEIYNLEKRGALGPVIKTYQEMMESVLYHPNIIEAIKKLSSEQGKSERALRKKAYKYYRAIAADFSIVVVKYFQKFMMWVFYKVFDDIKYNPEDFKKLREASRRGPLVIVPCHRSHMDYLIISSIFYENRIIPPHILAGDNLSFFPLGLLFRKSGAFFMKRSTRGKPLYVAVLRQYIKALVREGYSIEFFIEGGRTRTGKIMHPKLGMLKYLSEAAEEGYADDIMFVPVGINYDRVLEEKSFQKELRGGQKKGESNKDVIKSGKYLRGGYGGVYLTFQDPLSYRALKAEIAEADPVGSIATTIVKRISEGVVITPFALISASMLVSSVRGFSVHDLKKRAAFFMDYLKSIRVPLSDSLSDGTALDDAVDRVIETFERDGIISRLKMEGDESGYLDEFYALNEEQRTRINFYKNNIIHYLLPLSLYSAACIAASNGGNSVQAERIFEEFSRLVKLLAKEFVYPSSMDDLRKAVDEACGYFERTGALTRDNGTVIFTEAGRDALHGCAGLLLDVMEAYYLVGSTIAEQKSRKIEKSDCIAQVRKNGVRRFHLGEIRHFESLALPYYQSALAVFAEMGFIRERKKDDGAAEFVLESREQLESLLDEMKRWLATVEEWARLRRVYLAVREEGGKEETASGPLH